LAICDVGNILGYALNAIVFRSIQTSSAYILLSCNQSSMSIHVMCNHVAENTGHLQSA